MLGRKKIVIIDDEQELCYLMAKNLEIAGDFEVKYAFTGREGIRLVKNEKPDLVFLDIGLGNISGLDLIEDILNIDKDIKIVMLTGKGTHEFVHAAFDSGAADFVTKPCEVDKLFEVIDKHLGLKLDLTRSVLNTFREGNVTKMVFFDVLASFVSVSEAKSQYLRGHAERVACISKTIGAKMELDKTCLEILECSAILHDLGKIGVKDAILDKPGKLTDEEWQDIRKHPVVGTEIIGKMRLFRLEEPIIKHHHERFDGQGYPDGIKGRKIPLEARIITLADSYDAMTSERPYRKSMTREAAVAEVDRNCATQFDPDVVKSFLACVDMF